MTQETEDVVRRLRYGTKVADDRRGVTEYRSTALEREAADLIQSLSDRIDVLEENIVELWHESEAGRKELHEYLGMTWEQYQVWASPDASLIKEGRDAAGR